MFEGIIWVAMALNAGKTGSHQGLPGRIDPVNDGSCPEFFIISTPFIIGHGIAVKCGCNKLFISGIGQEVSRELFCQKLVIGFILVEGFDQPVAIAPDGPDIIPFIAFRISVSCKVHPQGGPSFAIIFRGKKIINQVLICLV